MKNIIEVLEDKFNIKINDNRKLKERRIHLDCGRKFFSKGWILNLIDFMSFLELNVLTLHFSENKGFRIENDKYPEILSDEFLTKNDIKEIIFYAKSKNIDIMPSLDTPGHVRQILKVFPEFGQEDIHGNKSKEALSITNEKAKIFIKEIYKEYLELFEDSKVFHIGGDEFMEFEKEDFLLNYKKVLDDYAKEKLGKEYSWKDTFANYINDIANYVSSFGFIPRVWNDGLYYGDHNEDVKQKIILNQNIEVDFWCQMRWNPSISRLNTILEKGHNIYNLNSFFFYYVLRVDEPEDGRPKNSFDFKNQYKNIYENWTPGKFSDNTLEDSNHVIKGAAMCIWCDDPDLVDEDTVFSDIKKEMVSFSLKCLDYKINEKIEIEKILNSLDYI